MSSRAPSVADVWIFIYQAHVLHKTAPSPALQLIRSSGRWVERSLGEAGEDEGGSNWRRQKRKDKEDKEEEEEGNTRDGDSKGGEGWRLYTRPLPCCQVNAIWVFYRWDCSCWHLECTSYTLSSSPPHLLILYTVSPLTQTLPGTAQDLTLSKSGTFSDTPISNIHVGNQIT